MRRDIPQNWVTLMERRGYSSIRQLAAASGVSHTAVARIMHGEGRPKDESVQALAVTLGVKPNDLYGLVGVSAPDEAIPYEPPAEAARLSPRQRKAVDELIRLLAQADMGKTVDARHGLPEDFDLAALRGHNEGRRLKAEADQLGEETQAHD